MSENHNLARWSVVAVVPKEDEFLAIARRFNPSDINFPGGCDVPEDLTHVDTLRRMVLEDTGVKVLGWRVMSRPWLGRFREPVFPYFVTEWKGKIRPGASGKVLWASPEKLIQDSSTYSSYAKVLLKLLMRV